MMKQNQNKGITLIALIITVIVLLILVGTAISIAVNGGDVFSKATTAREQWNTAVEREETEINNLLTLLDSVPSITNNGEESTPPPTEITMTLGGVETILKPEDFMQSLGKVVTNYAPTETTVSYIPEAEGTTAETYIVSNVYRLYWIDWENKFGDGAGTIYLKADCTSNKYDIKDSLDNVLDGSVATSKIEQLNPSLYATGVTSPTSTNNNMKAARWLTDTSVWAGLKTGLSSSISSKVNYIVGAPCLEMFMDSYNAHYNLTGDTPDVSPISVGSRKKLFYRFISGDMGYQMGPNADNNTEYWSWASDRSVQTDSAIDSLYYPGTDNEYWLASPSYSHIDKLMVVATNRGGNAGCYAYTNECAFCPVVSLKPDAQL